jgi:drug/metabolite transporter (DMT)-like permease
VPALTQPRGIGDRLIARNSHLAGLGIVAASQTIFGSLGLFYKLALAGGATSLTILPLRFSLAAVPLWLLVLATGRRWRLPRGRVLALLGMGGGAYVGQSYFYLAALERIPLSTGTLILMIHPALVMAGAVLLGRERLAPSRLVALALSLGGAVLVVGSPGQTGPLDTFGVILALMSAAKYSTYMLLGDRILRGIDPLVASAYIIASAGVGFWVLAFAFGAFSLPSTTQAWLAILVIAWFCTVFGVTGLLAGLPLVGASVAAMVGMLEPFMAVLLGVLVLGEVLSLNMVVGGACILLAVFLLRKPTAIPARAAVAGADRESVRHA